MLINYLEWFGYMASFIVLISIVMSSIIKLRWINLIGSLMFAVYGYFIGSLPVTFMNLGIAAVNIMYLIKIYNSKEYFQILSISKESKYFNYLIKFYKDDLIEQFDEKNFIFDDNTIGLYILRDMVPAGVYLAEKIDDTTLEVILDFAIPAYRDFKIGKFIYEQNKDYFLNQGFNTFIAEAKTEKHQRYLLKMDFKYTDNGFYEKKLVS
ncbi:MAG: hypothetical protein JW702_10905 [Clostridiales bacterium]|nr:hypothetical protein [Clostridiales bacterium]